MITLLLFLLFYVKVKFTETTENDNSNAGNISRCVQGQTLHNEELYNLCSSQNIIRFIKSRRLGWAEHVARTERREKCTSFWWESPKERDNSEDWGVDGRMGSDWILGTLDGVWRGFSWLSVGTSSEILWMRWWTLRFWRQRLNYLVCYCTITRMQV
jgi:hypothetical protein